jgi:hypothetical protein
LAPGGRLEQVLRRLRGIPRQAPPQARPDLGPVSPFDALLEQRIAALERAVEDVKGRVNGLIFMVVGAVIAQIVLGFLR